MATDEDVQSRLDRIIIRVQGGMNVHDALNAENLHRWYYRELSPALRGSVNRARAEYVATRPDTTIDNSHLFRRFGCLMPAERVDKFEARCKEENLTMSYVANRLVNDWLNSPTSGVGSGVSSKI